MKTELQNKAIAALTACISRLKWHDEFPLDVAARQRAEKVLDELLLDELEKPVAPAPPIEHFTVIAVSLNTNSFGLKSILLLNEQGEGWEILKSAYGSDKLPERGDKIERVGGRFKIQHECPRRLPDFLPSKARKVITEATKK